MKKLFIVACLLGLCSGSALAYKSTPVKLCLGSPDQKTEYKISALEVDGDYLNKNYKTDYFYSKSDFYLIDNPQKPGKHLVFNVMDRLSGGYYKDYLTEGNYFTKENWRLETGWQNCGKPPQF